MTKTIAFFAGLAFGAIVGIAAVWQFQVKPLQESVQLEQRMHEATRAQLNLERSKPKN